MAHPDICVKGLVEYYFDIETTGKNPAQDKIIAIQWQKLRQSTWEPVGELNILKEWESSEKEVLEDFLPIAHCEYPWDFIFIGINLMFDFNFLNERAKRFGLRGLNLSYLYDHPFLDLKHILVLINDGRFKDYSKFLKGSYEEVDVPKLYRERKHKDIIKYIEKEAEVFGETLKILRREMPLLKEPLKGPRTSYSEK